MKRENEKVKQELSQIKRVRALMKSSILGLRLSIASALSAQNLTTTTSNAMRVEINDRIVGECRRTRTLSVLSYVDRQRT